ncbi:MAG TPA: serine/threonine-protein kinase [Urbifossiella sp.]|jgi:serine/threonine protein kinase|nr:serine/threonine-protein kinase [Urbifossiella sp.]
MSSPRDPDSGSVDLTFVPGAATNPDATVLPPDDRSAGDSSADRTEPSRGTHPSGGSAPTTIDPTRAADATVLPPAGEASADRTEPSRGTHHSGGSDPTALDATRAAPQFGAAAVDRTDVDVTRTAVSSPTASGRPSPAGVAVDRYVLRGFHAKGGLGEVHRALDLELDREVAFKRMQAGFADDPGWRETFVAEARVTARLDHPGIVPVFGLVADGHGRPCYAMRFIAGATLRQEIDRFYGTARRDGTPAVPTPADPDARRLAFRQLLQRFVAVCQAVGFAHTRGVIHRDLKPANIMVGEFGETLVVDWGLAKTLGSPLPDDPAVGGDPLAGTATLPLDPEERTAAGRAVGTPAFMPPEQALGSPDVGPAADVFGLGAIFFYVLTGRAPYAGQDATQTVRLAQKAEYPHPRSVAATVPPALEAVCLKAMAFAATDRYPSALDLAADVERWLSDEPVAAYPDPLPARAARWARRHPARIAGAGSALLAGLAAAVAIAAVVNGKNGEISAARDKAVEERGRAEKAEADTKTALKQLEGEQAKTLEQKTAAEKARLVAEGRFGMAQGAFANLIGSAQDELDDRAGTQKLRAAVLGKALTGLDELAASADGRVDPTEALRLRAWARVQMGDVHRSLGKPREALADYQKAAESAQELKKTNQHPAGHAGLADIHDRLADTYLSVGSVREAAKEAGLALDLRPEPKDGADPRGDLRAGTLDRVAAVALEEGQTHKATTTAGSALAIRRARFAAAENPTTRRGLAAALDRDAEVKLRVGDTAGSAASADEAVKHRDKVAEGMGDRVGPQRERAAAFSRVAEVAADRAILSTELKAREEASGILEKLAAKDPLNAAVQAEAAVARGRLGAARLRAGDLAAAQADADAGCARADALAKLDPESGWAARAVGLTRWDRGDVLLAAGKKAEAVAAFAAAVAAFEKLQAAEPESARAAREVIEARERLAAARVAAGDPGAALAPLTAAVDARQRAADADPANARAVRDLATAYGRLSDARFAAGNYAAAEDAAAAAAARFRTRATADPANLAAQRDLASARSTWARVTTARGEPTATLLLLHQARDGFDLVAAADPASTAAAEEKAAGLVRLADALGDANLTEFQQEYEQDALALREKLAAARPDNPAAQVGLVASKRRLAEKMVSDRRYPDADKSYGEAKAILARFPDNPVLAVEATAVAEGVEVLAGVRAAARNRESVKDLPQPVRARVLRQLAEDHLRFKQPVTATWAAGLLGENARGPDDLYRAAVLFARAAAQPGAPPEYRTAAVEWLGKAVDRGFRNPDLLRARWWDGLRDTAGFKAVEGRLAAPAGK